MTMILALLLAAGDPPTLFQRIQQHFAADPAAAASLGHPPPEMRDADWLIGTWDVSSEVEEVGGPPASGTSTISRALGGAWLEIRDVYPHGSETVAYVGYSPAERRWEMIGVDNLVNANRSSAGAWTGTSIVFEGDFVFLGMPAHLRQTIERQSPDNFTVLAEERLGERWVRTAIRYYHRHPAH
jgi:hypothetical protein